LVWNIYASLAEVLTVEQYTPAGGPFYGGPGVHQNTKRTQAENVREGEVATYIPDLAKVQPDDFGICLATVDGQVFSVGDWQREFTIQSICKPFAFLMALEEFGRDAVLERASSPAPTPSTLSSWSPRRCVRSIG